MTLADIAAGKPINNPLFPLLPQNKVSYDAVLRLPIDDGELGTPSFLYQTTINTIDNAGIVLIGDPYQKVQSVDLARATARVLSGSCVVDIAGYAPRFIGTEKSFWSPVFQRAFGPLEQEVLYIVAGFEKMDEHTLLRLFEFPQFETGFEHYQEKKGLWQGYKHKLLLLVTGLAEEAFREAGARHRARNLAEGNSSAVGTDFNFFERVRKAELWCVGGAGE